MKYKLTEGNGAKYITKDGHTMFAEDIVKDLNSIGKIAQKELLRELKERSSKQNFVEPVDNDNLWTWIDKKLEEVS